MEFFKTFLGGAGGAALVAGIFALIQQRTARKDQQAEKESVQNKALRYIMLYIIQERAMSHIREKKITVDARRALHKWHELYHNGLGGNGDADGLMAEVDELPTDTEG